MPDPQHPHLDALKGGFAVPPPANGSLLDAYTRWRARVAEQEQFSGEIGAIKSSLAALEKAVVTPSRTDVARERERQAKKAAKRLRQAKKAAAVATPRVIEARAMRKSVKRVRDAVDMGGGTPEALEVGYRHYRHHGGTGTFVAWKRSLAR